MNDTITKALLLAIALGLWANALNPWIRPVTVWASHEGLSEIYSVVSSMQSDLGRIQRGTCTNDKIC